MYQYVPSTYWYILMLYHICLHFEGYIPVHTDFFSVCTFDFRILLRRPPGQPVCLPAIYAPAHPLSSITLKQVQVHSLLLAATLGGGGRGGRRRRWRHWQVHCSGLRRRWRLQVCCIRLDQGQRVCCRALGLRCHSGTSPRQ